MSATGTAFTPRASAKLRAPSARRGLVERSKLIDQLREGRDKKLTLVCAPAGYGKTTLLSQWQRGDEREVNFVWLSLDELDSDPGRFWSHLVAGLHEAHPRAGTASLDLVAGGPSAIASVVIPTLIDELADASPLVLVMDDWHLVKSPVCDELLTSFVESAPEDVQVVVSSRSDPGLPVARYRAHGELAEVRERDLRMSAAEVADLFRVIAVELDPDVAERLTERTEGWAAGLCLARIVVKGRPDAREFVAVFSGDSRLVLDYLTKDVLASVNPELRDFLVRTSVLERLSASLCNAVLERRDSAAMLRSAEEANLFLFPLDEMGLEYRYHHLFATVLRRELEVADPTAAPELHARASLWLEAHGDIESAIDHAIEARDVVRSSTLVTSAGVSLLSAGRVVTMSRWFEALSWPEAQADRSLALMRALTAGLSGEGRDQVERWLAVAEDGPDFGPLANGISSIRSAVAMVSSTYLSRGVADAERASRLVLENEPAGSAWRYAGLVPLGQALFLAGRPGEARGPLEEARTIPGARRLASTANATAYLALVELAAGVVGRAERLAGDALAIAEGIGHGESPVATNPHVALACVLMHSSDLHGAIEHLEQAVRLSREAGASYWHAHALLRLADARHRLGDTRGARDALDTAHDELLELPDRGMLELLVEDTEAKLSTRPRRDGFLGDDMSDAELKVFQGLVSGASLSEVARSLYLSPNTVKTHRRSIYRKLGVTTREELLARAAELGAEESRH